MRPIVPGIGTLAQHLKQLKEAPETYRPKRCPHCGKAGVWCHGAYTRKSDCEGRGDDCLNPVPIPRFYCCHCRRTCSALPECIPPRRWFCGRSSKRRSFCVWRESRSRRPLNRYSPVRIRSGAGGRACTPVFPSMAFICADTLPNGVFIKV
jgi:hypothetical protein